MQHMPGCARAHACSRGCNPLMLTLPIQVSMRGRLTASTTCTSSSPSGSCRPLTPHQRTDVRERRSASRCLVDQKRGQVCTTAPSQWETAACPNKPGGSQGDARAYRPRWRAACPKQWDVEAIRVQKGLQGGGGNEGAAPMPGEGVAWWLGSARGAAAEVSSQAPAAWWIARTNQWHAPLRGPALLPPWTALLVPAYLSHASSPGSRNGLPPNTWHRYEKSAQGGRRLVARHDDCLQHGTSTAGHQGRNSMPRAAPPLHLPTLHTSRQCSLMICAHLVGP